MTKTELVKLASDVHEAIYAAGCECRAPGCGCEEHDCVRAERVSHREALEGTEKLLEAIKGIKPKRYGGV